MMSQPSPLVVRSLICHRDVNMAITCLGSLLRFSAEPIALILHEDGSLTLDDREKLSSALNQPTILSRREADEQMEERLRHHPVARQYRREQVFGLKLLDIALLSQTDIAYCDTDILFFKPFSNLFQFPDAKTGAIFMLDFQEAYSIPIRHLIDQRTFGLASRVNAGLMSIRKDAYDLDFIEWFLKQPQFRMIMGWHEQTCWAALGNRIGAASWDSEQIAMIQPQTVYNDAIVAGHFTTPFRSLLPKFVTYLSTVSPQQEPIGITKNPARSCNLPLLLKAHTRVYLGGVKRDVLAYMRQTKLKRA